MSKYKVNSLKHTSPMKKYEYIREVGYPVLNEHGQETLLKGKALDDYIERKMWDRKHPGQEPIREGELKDGLPTE